MRVLHVIPTLGSGGAEKMLVDIVEKMTGQGVVCEIAVLSSKDNKYGSKLNSLGIKLYYSHNENVYDPRNILFIKSIIQNGNYNLIHTHLYAAQLFTPFAQLFLRNKVNLITTEHSTSNRRREKKLFYFLDNWMYKRYKKIVAISNGTKDSLSKYLKNTADKIIVIYNGINLSDYEAAVPINRYLISPDISNEEILILMVAAFRDQKDHETLIRASKLLPENYRVIFVGDGDRLIEVKNYAVEFGKGNILFLGFREDVPLIMKAADIFVLSSKWEGFGLVVVEASASGLPVIASNVEGLKEVVQELNGTLFSTGNEYDLAEKIINIDMSKKYSNLEKYTIFNTVKQYIDLYNKLINKI